MMKYRLGKNLDYNGVFDRDILGEFRVSTTEGNCLQNDHHSGEGGGGGGEVNIEYICYTIFSKVLCPSF